MTTRRRQIPHVGMRCRKNLLLGPTRWTRNKRPVWLVVQKHSLRSNRVHHEREKDPTRVLKDNTFVKRVRQMILGDNQDS